MENTNKTKDNTHYQHYYVMFNGQRNCRAYLLSASSEDDESLKLNNRLFRPMKFTVQHEMT
ncbi:hypothetical protein T07_2934 [Trichinella nelsoni]|uniref:Uncharacterized protein n=1 Tax=Trichinella nelsoni TaxID=6336 RepID=A0A0V0RP21_9BILA|nr:hypothetical protein T07_2934 [Trichinella nelsoni]